MENIRHGTLVGDNCFYFFPLLAFLVPEQKQGTIFFSFFLFFFEK
jgi:hypothetical protein